MSKQSRTYLRQSLLLLGTLLAVGGCTSTTPLHTHTDAGPHHRPAKSASDTRLNTPVETDLTTPSQSITQSEDSRVSPKLLQPTSPRQTGRLEHPALREVSGLTAARRTPGALFAINDSGNPATLYMLDHSGRHLASWPLGVPNRDWEDLASVLIDDRPYLVVGDTGDNLKIHRHSALHLFEEPLLTSDGLELQPMSTVRFTYDDGPRNVEAFAIDNGIVYFISKEPVTPQGPAASRLYTLPLPDKATSELMTASFVATLPAGKFSFEARLASSLAGINLNQATALEFDESGNTAFILTYLDVLSVTKKQGQTWPETFAVSTNRVYTHRLKQAESMALSAGRILWITSEQTSAPLWAVPVPAPL